MQKQYSFLKQYVPTTAESLLVEISEEVDIKRKNTLRLHRAIIMAPLTTITKDYVNNIDNLLAPNEIETPAIPPQFVQQTSFLFTFLHSNLSMLISSVVSCHQNSNFGLLIYSSIPSLFGFFSSQEHINLAFSFYMQVLTEASPEIGSSILLPFYRSACMYRFFESIFIPFFDRFLHGPRMVDQNEMYANDLLKLITKASVLIPKSHSVIIALMKLQWGESNCIHFFIKKMLKNHAIDWLVSNGHSEKRASLNSVFDVLAQPNYGSQIILAISNAQSLTEAPNLYTVFDHPYIMYYTSIKDVLALVKLSKSFENFPQSLCELEYGEASHSAMFWVRVYPKLSPSCDVFTPERSLVFERENDRIESDEFLDDMYERTWLKLLAAAEPTGEEPYSFLMSPSMDSIRHSLPPKFEEYALSKAIQALQAKANAFEDLMLYRVHFVELEKWLVEIDRMFHKASAAIAISLIPKKIKKIDEDYAKATMYFHDKATCRDQFLRVLEKRLPKLTKSVAKDLIQLDNAWGTLVCYFSQQLSMNIDLNQAASGIFWECVEKLRLIDTDSLNVSFDAFLQVLRLLDSLVQVDPRNLFVYEYAFSLSQAKKLLSLYLIINLFAFSHQSFSSLLDEQDTMLWLKLEGILLKLVVANKAVAGPYFRIHEALGGAPLS